MCKSFAESGNSSDRVKSDCWVGVSPDRNKSLEIELHSKVDYLYEDSIRDLVTKMADFFGFSGHIEIRDKGALDFVLMARIESAFKKAGIGREKSFLPEYKYDFKESSKERFRRSRLYLPGDQAKLFINAPVHKPDGLILDLEDSVAVTKKEDARILVRNTLRALDFMGAERMVRINQLPAGLEDLEYILPAKPDLILIPKVESPDQIKEVDAKVAEISRNYPEVKERNLFYMPIIESAAGVMRAFDIALASHRNAALAIGLEDYTADIGTERTQSGSESFYARSVIVNAAKAAGIQAIDTVYSDVKDMDGLYKSVSEAKALGFDGKGCIHPRQIAVVHSAFAPSETEIKKAKAIVLAFEKAQREGKGVVSLKNKMIDPPVVKRALRTIDIAERESLISPLWREEDDQKS